MTARLVSGEKTEDIYKKNCRVKYQGLSVIGFCKLFCFVVLFIQNTTYLQ